MTCAPPIDLFVFSDFHIGNSKKITNCLLAEQIYKLFLVFRQRFLSYPKTGIRLHETGVYENVSFMFLRAFRIPLRKNDMHCCATIIPIVIPCRENGRRDTNFHVLSHFLNQTRLSCSGLVSLLKRLVELHGFLLFSQLSH